MRTNQNQFKNSREKKEKEMRGKRKKERDERGNRLKDVSCLPKSLSFIIHQNVVSSCKLFVDTFAVTFAVTFVHTFAVTSVDTFVDTFLLQFRPSNIDVRLIGHR